MRDRLKSLRQNPRQRPSKLRSSREVPSGEQQLASLVLSPRSDDMDRFPNDPLETAILVIASIGIAGGLFSLWYLAQQMPQ